MGGSSEGEGCGAGPGPQAPEQPAAAAQPGLAATGSAASSADSEGGSVSSPAVGGARASSSDASGAPAPDLQQLRLLGRQLLQGWAEALAALTKLPGVGGMRVDALAASLVELSRDASPGGAAALASQASSSSAEAAAAADAAAALGGRGGSGGAAALPPSELAGPNCSQRQAYSDPVDMFATAAKSAHLSYPELLHAFAASAEGAWWACSHASRLLHGLPGWPAGRPAVMLCGAMAASCWLCRAHALAPAALPPACLHTPAAMPCSPLQPQLTHFPMPHPHPHPLKP